MSRFLRTQSAFMRPSALAFAALVLASTPAEARSDEALSDLLERSVTRAETLVAEGRVVEGLHLASLAMGLYPDDPRIEALELTGYEAKVYSRALGHNLGRRVQRDGPSVLRRVVFYIPDRILDLVAIPISIRLALSSSRLSARP